MGYYTHYKLSARTIDGKASDLPQEAFSLGGEAWETSGVDAIPSGCEVKWYGHDSDMVQLSTRHQDIVFVLDGDGEEAGDVWRKFYLNGKMHCWRASVERPPLTQEIIERLQES
jgi:hypothetical protein